MKIKVSAVFVLFCVLVVLAGCEGGPGGKSSQKSGRAVLPADIAGTWKAPYKPGPWEIVLSPEGTVASAVIPMMTAEIKPHKITKVRMLDDTYSTIKGGEFVVEYEPSTRELFVSIEVEEFHIVFLENRLEGNSMYRFVGPVSEDGKVWMADFIHVFDWGPRFPQDEEDIYAEPLIFEKIEK